MELLACAVTPEFIASTIGSRLMCSPDYWDSEFVIRLTKFLSNIILSENPETKPQT
jgi:hypothetical protein